MMKHIDTNCFWCKKELHQRIDTFQRQSNRYGHSCCKRCFGNEQSFKDARKRVMLAENPFKGKTHSDTSKAKMSKSSIGKPAWNKGMRKKKRPVIPGSINKWMEFKKTILERDCHSCWKCGGKDRIECHHTVSKTRQPEHKYDPHVIITLCYWCHKEFHKEFTIRHFKSQDTLNWLNRDRSESDRVFFC